MNIGSPASPSHPAIDGRTLLFPVVGHPVSQVKAPSAFNALFRNAGVNARVVPLDLPPETVVETCRALLSSPSVGGILVTVPYKQTLFALAQRTGSAARVVGAVNALRRGVDGRIVGDLFDGVGFVAGLLAGGHAVERRRFLLLGAGGAGSAIAAALVDAGAGWVGIFDPDSARASRLAQTLTADAGSSTAVEAVATLSLPCDVVINATPLGMRAADPLPIDPARLATTTLVVDVIMEPAVTPLLGRARALGLATHPGRPMLDHQLPAYLDFFQLPDVARLARSSLATASSALAVHC